MASMEISCSCGLECIIDEFSIPPPLPGAGSPVDGAPALTSSTGLSAGFGASGCATHPALATPGAGAFVLFCGLFSAVPPKIPSSIISFITDLASLGGFSTLPFLTMICSVYTTPSLPCFFTDGSEIIICSFLTLSDSGIAMSASIMTPLPMWWAVSRNYIYHWVAFSARHAWLEGRSGRIRGVFGRIAVGVLEELGPTLLGELFLGYERSDVPFKPRPYLALVDL